MFDTCYYACMCATCRKTRRSIGSSSTCLPPGPRPSKSQRTVRLFAFVVCLLKLYSVYNNGVFILTSTSTLYCQKSNDLVRQVHVMNTDSERPVNISTFCPPPTSVILYSRHKLTTESEMGICAIELSLQLFHDAYHHTFNVAWKNIHKSKIYFPVKRKNRINNIRTESRVELLETVSELCLVTLSSTKRVRTSVIRQFHRCVVTLSIRNSAQNQ